MQFVLMAALVLLSFSLRAQTPVSHSVIAVHCGALLDPKTDSVIKDAVILVENGTVKQVGTGVTFLPALNQSISRKASACLD